MIIESALPIQTHHLSRDKANSVNSHVIIDAMINTLCKNLIHNKKIDNKSLRFSEVTTSSEFEKIIALRLKMYERNNAYLLDELNNGIDEFDARSCIYAAWVNDQVVATIRLTPYPFETLKFIDENELINFLGSDYKIRYLEWSRLLIDQDARILGMIPSLLIYAGMKVLTSTEYQGYFGFTKPIVRKLMHKFSISTESLAFTIPARDNNEYLLLKGDFSTDFWKLAHRDFAMSPAK